MSAHRLTIFDQNLCCTDSVTKNNQEILLQCKTEEEKYTLTVAT